MNYTRGARSFFSYVPSVLVRVIGTAVLCNIGMALWISTASAEEVLLKVIGSDGSVEDFDRDRLQSLEMHSFRTKTRWVSTEQEYSGPSLNDVLSEAGLDDTKYDLVALDYYRVTVDVRSNLITEDYPIIALLRDGEPFDLRDRGPLWVMFPYDDQSHLNQPKAYAYSVWQLTRIEAAGGARNR